MGLETGTYINDLNTANPTASDTKSQGDDHLRLVKTVLKNTFPGFTGHVIGTGVEAQGATVNDYTVTISPAPASYIASTAVVFKTTHACTGACTLQVNALGTKPLLGCDGAALSSGDIASGELVAAFYDGTSFFLLSGNDRASRDGDTYAGTHNMTGAVLTVASATLGAQPYTKTQVDATFAPLASPALTGTPTAPTRPIGTGGNAIATMGALAAASIVAAASSPPDPFFQFGII